jgi:hypothetical protein
MTITSRELDMGPKWDQFGVHNDLPVYMVYRPELRRWVESQDKSLWKPYVYSPSDYVFTKEMEVLFLLRWS